MNSETIKKYAVNFSRARSNLLLMLAFTAMNLILSFSGSDFFLLFSATLPAIIYHATWLFNTEAMGFAAAFAIVAIYCLFWYLSKKRRVFIVAALVFFAIDTIVLFVLLAVGFGSIDLDPFFIIEILFPIWILYYLITGSIAWLKLKNVSTSDISKIRQDAAKESGADEAAKAVKNLGFDDKDKE